MLLHILGVGLTPYQKEYRLLLIKSALLRKPVELPIQWSRQTGKTETNVHAAMALAIYHIRWLSQAYPVAIITPARQEQSIIVTRERLRTYADRLKPWLQPVLGIDFALDRGRRTSDYIFTSSQGFEAPFHCVSASPRAFQKGQTYPLMFLEQIEDMDQFVMENNIFPFGAGSDIGSVIVLAGSATPKVTNNYYYDAIQRLRETVGIRPPWFVDGELGAQYKPRYGEYLTHMREKLGPTNPSFLTQFANVWVQPVNRPFGRELLRLITWDKAATEFEGQLKRAVGIDVAKDVDSTVLTGGFRYGADSYIDGWLELTGLDYEKQADRAIEFIKQGNYSTAEIDKNGPGNVLGDMLKKRLAEQQVRCTLNLQPLTAESNNRIYLQYDNEINQKRLHYPAEKTREQARFFEQHEDVLRTYGAKNMMKLEAPSGQHDDYVASGALMIDALFAPVDRRKPLMRARGTGF